MVEGLIPALMGAMEAASAGTAAKGTMDMMNSGKGKPKVLGDGLMDSPSGKIPEGTVDKINSILGELTMPGFKAITSVIGNYLDEPTSKKKAKSKDTFKTPEEIQRIIDDDLYLSIKNHSDKDGLLTTLGMAGLSSPELRGIGSTGKIPSEVLKKLSPELMKDLAAGLGIALTPKGSGNMLVSGKDIAKQIRSSESYSNMMADFDPNDDDDEEEKKDKKDKKQKLNRKLDDASEKYADAMNKKITKGDAEKLVDIAKEGQRLDTKPNTLKDLINKGGRFSHDWRQAESLLRKVGGDAAKPLIDKLYNGTYTAEEMQQLEEAVSSLAEVAKDVLMH